MYDLNRHFANKRLLALLGLSVGWTLVLLLSMWGLSFLTNLPLLLQWAIGCIIPTLGLFWFMLYRERWLRHKIKPLLRRERSAFHEEITGFREALRNRTNLNDVLGRLSNLLPSLFQTEHVLVFFQQDGNLFAITAGSPSQRWVRHHEVTFDDPLILYLTSLGYRQVLTKKELRALHSPIATALLDHQLTRLVPLIGGGGDVVGGLAIGPLMKGSATRKSLNSLMIDIAERIVWSLERATLYLKSKREAAERGVIFELNQRLTSVTDLHEFLDYVMETISSVVPFDAGGIFLLNDSTQLLEESALRGYSPESCCMVPLKVGQGVVGQVIENGKAHIIPDVSREEKYLRAREETQSGLVMPISIKDTVIGAINLESDQPAFYTQVHLEMLRTFAGQAAIAIQTARMYLDVEKKKQLDADLKVAGTIQRGLLPHQLPAVTGYDVHAYHRYTGAVGGDFYDMSEMADGQLRIAIGDAAGKGISGALLMTTLSASLAVRSDDNLSINQIVSDLNDVLAKLTESDKYVTLFYSVFDPATGQFHFTNAGHNPPVLIRADGSYELLELGGPVVGFFPHMEYQVGTVEMRPDDLLVMFTDGVTEVMNNDEEEYGEERLFSFLTKNRTLHLQTLEQSLKEELRAFAGDQPTYIDDRTLVLMRRQGVTQSEGVVSA
jgi:phosphoserine phosphatase RsbU/P